MPRTFFRADGSYYETVLDQPVRDGETVAPKRPSGNHEWIPDGPSGGRWEYREPPGRSPAQLDQAAEERANAFLDRPAMAGLFQVIAELKATADGTDVAQAAAQIRGRVTASTRADEVRQDEDRRQEGRPPGAGGGGS